MIWRALLPSYPKAFISGAFWLTVVFAATQHPAVYSRSFPLHSSRGTGGFTLLPRRRNKDCKDTPGTARSLAEGANACRARPSSGTLPRVLLEQFPWGGTRWGCSFLHSVPTLQPAGNCHGLADLCDITNVILSCYSFLLLLIFFFLKF